jgi:muramoyltetrapeptide carboxypeptidase
LVVVLDALEPPPPTHIMLNIVRRSGFSPGPAAVVAGTFTNSGDEEGIQAVLDDRLGDLGIPVVTAANVGHGGHVQTWPIGVRARLDADARTVTFLEAPLL